MENSKFKNLVRFTKTSTIFNSKLCRLMIIFIYICISGAIIFGSDQEVREVMRAVRRNNATGVFSWIGSDGWSARNLVSDGNEPEVNEYIFLFYLIFFLWN